MNGIQWRRRLRSCLLLICIPIVINLTAFPATSSGESSADFIPSVRSGGWNNIKVKADTSIDNEYEDLFEIWERFHFRTSGPLGRRTRFHISFEMEYSVRVGEDTEPEYLGELEEAYFDFNFRRLFFRAGKQIIAWGRMDAISPIDVINPLDFRESLIPSVENPRIPILALKGSYSFGFFQFEGVFIPFHVPHRINIFGTDYSLLKPDLFHDLLDTLSEGPEGDGMSEFYQSISSMIASELEGMNPSYRSALQPLLGVTEIPDEVIDNVQGGFRMKGSAGGADFGISYLSMLSSFPTITLSPLLKGIFLYREYPSITELQEILEGGDYTFFEGKYERYSLMGVDLGLILGDFALKGEGAYLDRKTFLDDELNPRHSPVLMGTAEVMYTHGTTFLLFIQGLYSRLIDYRDDLILIDRDNYSLTSGLIWTLLGERLKMELRSSYSINFRDYYMGILFNYSLSDRDSLMAGTNILTGEGGDLKADDLMTPESLRFGPFAYFSSNDEIYLIYHRAF